MTKDSELTTVKNPKSHRLYQCFLALLDVSRDQAGDKAQKQGPHCGQLFNILQG